MKKFRYVLMIIMILFVSTQALKSYSPNGKSFGIGVMVGEPTGLTLKLWTQRDIAIAISIGNSYFGSLRIGADYLWHFNAFNSSIVNLYAGPGIAVGIGESGGWWYKNKNKYWYKGENETAVGIRGILGMNIVPRNSPIEIFGEIGLMIGILPMTHTNGEGSVGIRFYF
jgi:hypothetical protein